MFQSTNRKGKGMRKAFEKWDGYGFNSTLKSKKRSRQAARSPLALVFAVEAFEQRLFAGSMLSPAGSVASPAVVAALDNAVAQTAASISGPSLDGVPAS